MQHNLTSIIVHNYAANIEFPDKNSNFVLFKNILKKLFFNFKGNNIGANF